MIVRAVGVTKAFGRGAPVLRVDELALAGPGLVRVDGANGAGKSTLLRLLAGVTRPTRGRIEWATMVVLDEPFAALDAQAAAELEQLLLARAREALVVLADHEERLAPAARVLVAGGEAGMASSDWRASLRAAGIVVRER